VNSYAVEVKPSARKELEALSGSVLARVVRKLEALGHTPRRSNSAFPLPDLARPTGCKKLKGFKDHWRVRVGDWPVVYIIDDAARVVSATRIAHRREVYD
jgi:mRNA interferase RelE/StbE